MIGYLIFIGGLVYGAVLMNISHQWIAVGARRIQPRSA
jgi:hypothetical protein